MQRSTITELLFVSVVLALISDGNCCVQIVRDAYGKVKSGIQSTFQKIKKTAQAGKPKYVGCYKDNEDNRDLQFIGKREPDMKVSKCQDICIREYPMTKYFGLQNGNICFCGNDYGNYGVERDGHCDKPCAGDKAEICGGELLNSVYQKYGP